MIYEKWLKYAHYNNMKVQDLIDKIKTLRACGYLRQTKKLKDDFPVNILEYLINEICVYILIYSENLLIPIYIRHTLESLILILKYFF